MAFEKDIEEGLRSMKIAQLIPAKARAVVYSVIGAAVGLEAIFNVVPDVFEGKVLSALVVLGFGVAVSNVPKADKPEGDAA